jgi:hypothetical protein
MLRERPGYIIEDANELVAIKFALEQIFHPLLLAALAVALGYGVVGAGQDWPSYASDRIWNAFPCS